MPARSGDALRAAGPCKRPGLAAVTLHGAHELQERIGVDPRVLVPDNRPDVQSAADLRREGLLDICIKITIFNTKSITFNANPSFFNANSSILMEMATRSVGRSLA